MKTIANHERHKIKQNSESYKKNKKNKYEYHQSSRINNV